MIVGNYTLQAIDANGCTATKFVEILYVEPPFNITASATKSCNGELNVVTYASTGGVGVISYNVQPASANSWAVAGNIPSPFSSYANTYSITATDADFNTTFTVIELLDVVNATGSVVEATCFGDSSTLIFAATAGTAPFTYKLVNANDILPNGQYATIVNNITSPFTFVDTNTNAYYTVVVTDANGCSTFAYTPLNTPDKINITTQPTVCYDYPGNKIAVLENAFGNYTISAAVGNTPIPLLTIPTGVYTFTAIDDNGCSVTEVNSFVRLPDINLTTVITNALSPTGNGSIAFTATGSSNSFNYLINGNPATAPYVAPIGTYTIQAIDNDYGCAKESIVTIIEQLTLVTLSPKVFLGGCFNPTTNLMYDSLRSKNLIPLTEPYTSLPYSTIYGNTASNVGATVSNSVLAVTGNNAIVDWVIVELRSSTDSTIVVATQYALVQRDGDVVSVDGTSPVSILTSNFASSYVAIKHRNHLAVMTKFPVIFIAGTNIIDFTNMATLLYTKAGKKGNLAPLTGAAKVVGTVNTMYPGNCNLSTINLAHTYVVYNSTVNSDRIALFNYTNGINVINGYDIFDVNMDGITRFNGFNPDRITILNAVGNSNVLFANEQLP